MLNPETGGRDHPEAYQLLSDSASVDAAKDIIDEVRAQYRANLVNDVEMDASYLTSQITSRANARRHVLDTERYLSGQGDPIHPDHQALSDAFRADPSSVTPEQRAEIQAQHTQNLINGRGGSLVEAYQAASTATLAAREREAERLADLARQADELARQQAQQRTQMLDGLKTSANFLILGDGLTPAAGAAPYNEPLSVNERDALDKFARRFSLAVNPTPPSGAPTPLDPRSNDLLNIVRSGDRAAARQALNALVTDEASQEVALTVMNNSGFTDMRPDREVQTALKPLKVQVAATSEVASDDEREKAMELIAFLKEKVVTYATGSSTPPIPGKINLPESSRAGRATLTLGHLGNEDPPMEMWMVDTFNEGLSALSTSPEMGAALVQFSRDFALTQKQKPVNKTILRDGVNLGPDGVKFMTPLEEDEKAALKAFVEGIAAKPAVGNAICADRRSPTAQAFFDLQRMVNGTEQFIPDDERDEVRKRLKLLMDAEPGLTLMQELQRDNKLLQPPKEPEGPEARRGGAEAETLPITKIIPSHRNLEMAWKRDLSPAEMRVLKDMGLKVAKVGSETVVGGLTEIQAAELALRLADQANVKTNDNSPNKIVTQRLNVVLDDIGGIKNQSRVSAFMGVAMETMGRDTSVVPVKPKYNQPIIPREVADMLAGHTGGGSPDPFAASSTSRPRTHGHGRGGGGHGGGRP